MILLRHCQSQFNQHYDRFGRDPGITDPSLTENGHAQAERAAERLCAASAPPIRRLLVSPYRRTLQTAAPIAARLGLRPEVAVLARERFAFSCDVGSPPGRLAHDWPGVDFSTLDETWWHVGTKGDAVGQVVESEQEVLDRADAFRRVVLDDPRHAETLLVSHWGFLLSLSGQALQNGEAIPFDPALGPEQRINRG